MADYIDREEALNAIKMAELGREYDAVEALPSADVRENVRGEWIEGRYEIDSKAYYEGDDLTPLKKHGLIVNAWMPLPAPYKGTKIAISGELEQDTYEKPNGEKIERVGIKVNYHEFVEPKRAETPEDFADPFVEVPEEVLFA